MKFNQMSLKLIRIKSILFFLMILALFGFSQTKEIVRSQDEGFSFAFLTDIHLSYKSNGCFEGLQKAMGKSVEAGAEFIITGGDNADIDKLRTDPELAHRLIGEVSKLYSTFEIPVYASLGNHDRYRGGDPNDPIYDKGLFEKYIHQSYYSFDHKNWHFIILNTVQSCNGSYCVGDKQIEWLKKDISEIDQGTPIIISTHVPFFSVSYQAQTGKTDKSKTFSNFKQVLDLFDGRNLKLVLQGHQHLYEEINVKGIQFITAGAVCGSWWRGPYEDTEEGFLMVKVDGDKFEWEYIDYEWDVLK
jgi:UDP-2,3-diacylglucosamine pyrophosphatase LpxH